MKAKKHLAPNLEVFEAWKRTNTQSLPTTVPELTLLVEALRYRLKHIYKVGEAETKYVDMPIRALTAFVNGPLPKNGNAYWLGVAASLMLLVSPKKKGAHHLPTLHLQKALLIDRLADFKGLKLAHQVRERLQRMQTDLLAELSVYPCFCNYEVTLNSILMPEGKTKRPIPPRSWRGVDLIYLILGQLHNVSATHIQTILKQPPINNDSINCERLAAFLRTFE